MVSTVFTIIILHLWRTFDQLLITMNLLFQKNANETKENKKPTVR